MNGLQMNSAILLNCRLAAPKFAWLAFALMVFGGVLTNHSERLFVMTQSPNKTIRLSALELLGVLLRQGLVNPNEAIPYLFALQGDVDHSNIRCDFRQRQLF